MISFFKSNTSYISPPDFVNIVVEGLCTSTRKMSNGDTIVECRGVGVEREVIGGSTFSSDPLVVVF